MRQDVTFEEMAAVINARIQLLIAQHGLWINRVSGRTRWEESWHEAAVCRALDRVWEAQQRAA
jgi:hypothetical protein